MRSPRKNQCNRLKNADWEEITPRALLWALSYHRRYLASYKNAPSPMDLFQDAVTALFAGNRALPEDQEILVVIIKVMQSEGSKFLKAQLTRVSYNNEIIESRRHQSNAQNPSNELEFSQMLAYMADDENACSILKILREDPKMRPRHLAEDLELTDDEVYNTLKRIRRKLSHYLNVYDKIR